MKIEKTEVYGFLAAIRGARNAMESWDQSDTHPHGGFHNSSYRDGEPMPEDLMVEDYIIGDKDLKLLSDLVRRGDEHAKFARIIWVNVDLTLPRYILTELDTYKIATTRLSCSTRPATLKKNVFELSMFQTDGLEAEDLEILEIVINHLDKLNNGYNQTKDKSYLRRLKKLLPEAYLQKATFDFNYQTLRHIYLQRKGHWLEEWSEICQWIESLPYAAQLITCQNYHLTRRDQSERFKE